MLLKDLSGIVDVAALKSYVKLSARANQGKIWQGDTQFNIMSQAEAAD